MGRRKKIAFKLNPEWMLKEPLDFEYNKYTLLDYIQKCEQRLDKFEIYPDFVELSLHLANMQSLSKENTLLLTDKKFHSYDDEIMLKDLYPKKPREMSKEEEDELGRTIKYSNNKLFDTFNIAKSIWNIVFDEVEISIKKKRGDKNISQTYITKIYENTPDKTTLLSIIENHSKFNKTEYYKDLPVFEMLCSQNFPMEQAIVPIMKRKITAYIFQIVNMVKVKNFDSEI